MVEVDYFLSAWPTKLPYRLSLLYHALPPHCNKKVQPSLIETTKIETTKYTKYTKKGLHVEIKPRIYTNTLHVERKPRNTRKTRKKDCMWRGNHRTRRIRRKKDCQDGLETTKYTKKDCMLFFRSRTIMHATSHGHISVLC